VDSRLRRSPPDRASAVSYGQAGENAMRFPHLAHRSAAAHKLHSTTATTRYEFDSGEGETFSRQPALAYSPRKLSKQPEPSQIPVFLNSDSVVSRVGISMFVRFPRVRSHSSEQRLYFNHLSVLVDAVANLDQFASCRDAHLAG
jgi:hypothetical protein